MFLSLCEKLDFPTESLPALKKAYMSITENPNTVTLFEAAQAALLHPNQVIFDETIAELLNATNLHPYQLNAALCVSCLASLGGIYENLGQKTTFEGHTRSLKPQLLSCKEKHGIWGLEQGFWQWMFHEWQCHNIGRLEYEPFHHFRDIPYKGIQKGDPVILIHIPGGKPLNMDEVMASLELAYHKFKDQFANETVPFMTHSWLIYPPYLNGVFKEGGNLQKFAQLFDIIHQNAENYINFYNIFGCHYPGEDALCNVPQKTSLQRNILQYIKGGNVMGQGYGMFLYNKDGIIKNN